MHLLSTLLPLISNLNTSRYLLSSTNINNQVNIMDHQNSIQCLAQTVQFILRQAAFILDSNLT